MRRFGKGALRCWRCIGAGKSRSGKAVALLLFLPIKPVALVFASFCLDLQAFVRQAQMNGTGQISAPQARAGFLPAFAHCRCRMAEMILKTGRGNGVTSAAGTHKSG